MPKRRDMLTQITILLCFAELPNLTSISLSFLKGLRGLQGPALAKGKTLNFSLTFLGEGLI